MLRMQVRKIYNVTHKLLVKEKDIMRLAGAKCAISLTDCWS